MNIFSRQIVAELIIHARQTVHQGQGRHRSVRARKRIDQAIDYRPRQKGPRRVVNQYDIGAAFGRDRLEAITDRSLAGWPADDGVGKGYSTLPIIFFLSGPDYNSGFVDPGVIEALHGVGEQGLSGEARILFGEASAGAVAAACRRHQCDALSPSSHDLPLAEPGLVRQRL